MVRMRDVIVSTAVVLAFCATSSSAAFADPKDGWKQERERRHEGRGGSYKYEEKYDPRTGEYKIEEKGPGYKYEYKARRRGRGGPPPWAGGHARRHHGPVHTRVETVHVPTFDIDVGRCNRELLGAVIGAAAGGLLGSKVGKGDGQLAATAAGTIIGVLVGGSVGRSMDQVDQNCVGQALERANDGQTVKWQNPDERADYRVTPTRTYQTNTGAYCREYQTSIVIGGQVQRGHGTACRRPDGSWQRAG